MAANLTFISATDISAIVQYSASGYSLPSSPGSSNSSWGSWSGNDSVQTRTEYWTYTYNTNLTYTWDFGENGNIGNHTFDSLLPGKENLLEATVTITYNQITEYLAQDYQQTYVQDEGWSNPYPIGGTYKTSSDSVNTITIGSEAVSLPVYTKPSQFNWPITPRANGYIKESLTIDSWNELADKASQYISWQSQSDMYGSCNDAKTSREDNLISAQRYNIIADVLKISKVNRGDLITAKHFTDLSDVING